MEFTVADDRKSESAYRKAEVLFFGRDTFAHIYFERHIASLVTFSARGGGGGGDLAPWTSQQGHCPCTPPGPRRPLDPSLFPFFSKFQSVTHVIINRLQVYELCMTLFIIIYICIFLKIDQNEHQQFDTLKLISQVIVHPFIHYVANNPDLIMINVDQNRNQYGYHCKYVSAVTTAVTHFLASKLLVNTHGFIHKL